MSLCSRSIWFGMVGLAVLGLGGKQVQAQWHYYYFDKPQPLTLDTTQLAVFDAEEGAVAADTAVLSKHGIAAADIHLSVIPRMSLASVPAPARTEADVIALVRSIADEHEADFVSPVFGDAFGPWIVTRHLHVGFHDHVKPERAQAILAQAGAGVIVAHDWARMKGVYRVQSRSRSGFEVLETANKLAQHPDVKFAEPDMIMTGYAQLVPDDPGFPLCWGLHNTGQNGGTNDMDMDGPEAWDLMLGDPNIIVVVMDTGVQQDHPDLNQIPGFDATGSGTGGGPLNECDGHGTTVAGTISAVINNGLGTVGIAPECKVAGAKFGISNVPCDNTFSVQSSWLIDALSFAESINARVTNNSTTFGYSAAHRTKYDQTREAGLVHFTSAGNGGFGTIYPPGSFDSVNAVAALTRNGNLAGFSQWGTGLFISAPGVSIYTTDETGSLGFSSGDYVTVQGTSYASPYAAGVAALVFSMSPALRPDAVEGILAGTAVDLGNPGYDRRFGWGFVNAFQAVSAALPVQPCDLEKATASDAGDADEFGESVAMSGQVAVVGARLDDDLGADAGAVYVYRRDALAWNEEQKLTALDAAPADGFGDAVAVDGDLILVGAPDDEHNSLTTAGSAYVFRWDGGTWSEVQKLIASDALAGDEFGTSVAIDGDVLVIGAARVDGGGSDSGAAYVFRWNGVDGWDEEQKLTPFDPGQFDNYGTSVAVSGDTIVVGSPNDDDDGSGSGSAYIYRWDSGSWVLDQTSALPLGKLTASDAAAGDHFGRSVSVRGNDLLIGAFRDDDAGADAGSVYHFEWDSAKWVEQQEFYASDAGTGDYFGQSVSLGTGYAVVGAYRHDEIADNAGSAYVYRDAGAWIEDSELTASDAALSDRFGYSVAISDGFAIVGARADDHGDYVDAGSAYFYAVAGDCNGNQMADSCDVLEGTSPDEDGDGLADECACVIATAPDAETLDPPTAKWDNRAAAGPATVNVKSRFVSIMLRDAGRNQAIRVTFVDLPPPFDIWNGMQFFVGEPHEVCENSGKGLETAPQDCPAALPADTFWAAPLLCDPLYVYFMDWHGVCDAGTCLGGLTPGEICSVDGDCAQVVHLYHEGFVPEGTYAIQVIDGLCDLLQESSFSVALSVTQPSWGDVCGPSPAGACTSAADGVGDVTNDVLGVLDKFANVNNLQKTRADLEPGDGGGNAPDFKVNVANDVLFAVEAFTGAPYPFAAGDPCGPG